MYKVPILITVYNRPDLFKKLLTNLKKNKPSKIYIKGDGPKNEIDRKATKGRKIKYIVHEKLLNFMQPIENL